MNRHASSPANGKCVLYLSYDGMTDQLGASQVLPYLVGLTERGYRISLISFEKPERSGREMAEVQLACAATGITWHPLTYHKRPPVLSAMFDVARMRRLAERLHRRQRFDIVHCRSYLPALAGLSLKRRHGLRFLFDMRGFWADERVDGKIWNLANPLFRAVFNYFKRREADFLREADHVVSLTEAGKAILLARPDRGPDEPPITVIPCCANFDFFPPINPKRRAAARKLLAIAPDRRVVAYLGSIGTWYLLDEMLDFFRVVIERDPGALFLVISREEPSLFLESATAKGIPTDSFLIRSATREEVPAFIAAADHGLFFIKPVFSKKASSPVKMGEFLALELPMVTNGDVGDVAEIIAETGSGVIVDRFDGAAYHDALDRLDELTIDLPRWRRGARRWFDLETGIDRFDVIYRELGRES